MTARVYSAAHSRMARDQRALNGRAPALAVRRIILLRQLVTGRWAAAIWEWRFGRWLHPHWLCTAVALSNAREAAISAWQRHRLPLVWSYGGDGGTRRFHLGVNEPEDRI